MLVKISEAIMFAVHKAGGKIEYFQIAEWIGYLIKNGYLELASDGEDADIQFYLQLTEKGKVFVQKIQLN